MKDFSICIAHRGDALGLWATIESCEVELEGTKYDYEYCLCINGEFDPKRPKTSKRTMGVDIENIVTHLQNSGKLGYYSVFQDTLSPPTARQDASDHAQGRYIFFFDNHVIPARGYFDRAIKQMDAYGWDMLHSTTKWFTGDKVTVYHYELNLPDNFWAHGGLTPEWNGIRPYRIAAGGHGGFVVRTDVWREVGGYWDGFVGYGGEEIYFDLKMAMLDKSNWIDPQLVHWHYAGRRGYARHYTDDYYRNMLMCANIIGGQHWMEKVADSFLRRYPTTHENFYDLYMGAYYKSKEHADYLASIRKRTLDEQLEQFKRDGVAM